MAEVLDKTSRRIIGVLIEKELTTPNLYPLTLNALTNGCNQKSNRNPVLLLQEFEVEGALRTLFVHEWATNVSTAGSRVLKWRHRAADKLNLDEGSLAIMAELFLRGPQTAGELRSRVARMHPFSSLEDLQASLDAMRESGLVVLLPKSHGRRAQLFDHTLYPEDENPGEGVPDNELSVPESSLSQGSGLEDRVAALEEKVRRLEDRLGGEFFDAPE